MKRNDYKIHYIANRDVTELLFKSASITLTLRIELSLMLAMTLSISNTNSNYRNS